MTPRPVRTPRILLADADIFFAAVARLEDPEGAGKASLLIVGGRRESRGVVCSASYEARTFGVRSGMSIAQAVRLCPEAMCVPVPRKACVGKSREIRAVLERFTPVVSGASIDEWYMDLTGTEAVYRHEPLRVTAHRIREAVKSETQLSVSIGGGANRLVAKLAVERAKPKPGTGADGVHIVAPGDEAEFLRSFTLADLPMVGPKFQARLAERGMTTVPDVLAQDLATLRRWLGERSADWLWDRVHGVGDDTVDGRVDQKSMSRDETFAVDLSTDEDLTRELLKLVTRAAHDLRKSGLSARTVTVKLRDRDFRTRSARRTLPEPVVTDQVILKVASELLGKLRASRRVPARLIGVSLSSLAHDLASDQLAFFPAENPTRDRSRDLTLVKAMDRVRAKFGEKGIVPGSLVGE